MCTDVQIGIANISREAFVIRDLLVEYLKTAPTQLSHFVKDERFDMTSLQAFVFEKDIGANRGSVAVGIRSSIASLYDRTDVVHCLADSPLYWLRYGRGFCYLRLLLEAFRPRAASLLGPFPLVVDVLRFVVVVGLWSDTGFSLEYTGANLVHVECCELNKGTSMPAFIRRAVELDVDTKIGGGGFGDLLHDCGYGSVISSDKDIERFSAFVSSERSRNLETWMRKHRMESTPLIEACILVASSAMSSLNNPGMEYFRGRVRVWQVVGDLVCKQFAAYHVLASGQTVENYSLMVGNGAQSNKKMAALLLDSDMRSICYAPNLSLESKAWADILEGVIGVVSLTQSAVVLQSLLVDMKLIPPIPVEKVSEITFPKVLDLPGLNSQEFMELAALYLQTKRFSGAHR